MIIIDARDKNFCFEIKNALDGRGVDYNLFDGDSDNPTQSTQAAKNIFLSAMADLI